ncbi:MAG: hypothetical protein ABW049_11175 [Spongiibacteraceae bacterium]
MLLFWQQRGTDRFAALCGFTDSMRVFIGYFRIGIRAAMDSYLGALIIDLRRSEELTKIELRRGGWKVGENPAAGTEACKCHRSQINPA